MINTISTSTSPLVVESAFTGASVVEVIVILLFVLLIVTVKGYSLWYAARRDEKWWFICLLVLNTFGILELIYFMFIVKKWPSIYGKKGVSDSSTRMDTESK